jgi:hypothetical protein
MKLMPPCRLWCVLPIEHRMLPNWLLCPEWWRVLRERGDLSTGISLLRGHQLFTQRGRVLRRWHIVPVRLGVLWQRALLSP